MRPIDADALVKETTEVRCVNCDRRKGMKNGKMTFVYEIGDVPCRACDVMDMIDALEEAPTVGGWISVKDRLPEEDGTMRGYLVAIGDWVGIMAFYDGGFKEGLWGKEPEFPVHHWMPLPEPPEEVSGDA